MKKRTIYIIALGFSLVLLGIIALQLHWLNVAMDVKKKQFDNSVFTALQNVVKKTEELENVDLVNCCVNTDTTVAFTGKKGKHKMISVIASSSTVGGVKSRVIKNESVVVKMGSGKSEMQIVANDSDCRVQCGNLDELISENVNVSDKLDNIGLLIKKIVKSGSENGLKKITGEEAKELLNVELKQANIQIPMELVIKDSSAVSYSTSKDTASVIRSEYKIDLYPKDIFGRDVMLYVYFPKQFNYVAGDMQAAMGLSLLFTALLIFVFVYTLVSLNKQKKLNDIKSDFINNMNHELKTPIASIQLASDMLYKNLERMEADQVKTISKTIYDQAVKIGDDVKNILQHSLIENNANIQTGFEKIKLADLIADSLSSVKLLAEFKNIRFESESCPDMFVGVNKELILKAFINVLDNAIKYSGNSSCIKIGFVQDQKTVTIRIDDQGIGISSKHLPYVFDKFYRAETGDVHNSKGFGLGLSFVKRVIEMHQGKVWATSIEGKGSSFYIQLPAA